MTRTILKSSTGGVGPLPLITTPLSNDMPITSLSIDTKGINSTDILLYFTTEINLTATVSTNLMFIIKKYEAKSDPQLIGGSYIFSTAVEVAESESFAFQFLDSDVNPGRYTYSIELAPNCFVSIAAGVTLTNSTLSLIALCSEEAKNSKSGSSSSGSSSSDSSSSNNSNSSKNTSSESNSAEVNSTENEESKDSSSENKDLQSSSKEKDSDKKDEKKNDDKNDKKDEKKNDDKKDKKNDDKKDDKK